MAIDARVHLSKLDCFGRPFGVEAILKTLDRFRVEAAVLVSDMAVDTDFRLGGKELVEAVKADPRLYGCLVVNPAYTEQSVELMRSAMSSSRMVAMGIFGGTSRPYPNIDDCREIVNSYRRFAKPIYLHTPSAEAVNAAVRIAQEFSGIKFILGSMGGSEWRSVLAHAKQLNLILETSGSFDTEKIETVAGEFGAHRIIYGSGYPLSDMSAVLALVQSSRLPKESLARILGENAKSLFGIGRTPRQDNEE